MEENTKPKSIKEMDIDELRVHATTLNDYLNQAAMENRDLRSNLMRITAVQNKLPWLFKVIENETHFTEEFVESCANEVVKILTPSKPQEEQAETTTED